MHNKTFYVYILSNKYHSVFHTGVANNLVRRVFEHKEKIISGFTERYNINKLLYYEQFYDPENAIIREKQLKDYRREKKLALIEGINKNLIDLYETL